VRLDLLPALEAARPGFSRELLALSKRAAAWRSSVEDLVDALQPRRTGDSVYVDVDALRAYDARLHAFLWPALAARAGLALDRRGTERLAAFSTTGKGGLRRGGRVQLAGGHEVVRHSRAFEIRRARAAEPEQRRWTQEHSS
jgi:hypothetical protein